MAHVLLVDDETILRMALRQYLEFAGHTVDDAADGDEALSYLGRRVPDIVVSDVLMPVRDGLSLCREMRADPRLCRVPFLFITARNTGPRLYDEMARLGQGCIAKPFEPADFVATIENIAANNAH